MGPNFTPDLLLLPSFHPSLSTRRYSDDSALESLSLFLIYLLLRKELLDRRSPFLPPPVFPAAQSAKISGGGRRRILWRKSPEQAGGGGGGGGGGRLLGDSLIRQKSSLLLLLFSPSSLFSWELVGGLVGLGRRHYCLEKGKGMGQGIAAVNCVCRKRLLNQRGFRNKKKLFYTFFEALCSLRVS